MKIEDKEGVITVKLLSELSSATSEELKDAVIPAIKDDTKIIDVDMEDTVYLDSTGLGALISLHKKVGGKIRLINPTPAVTQILELTRMNKVFEIVRK